MLTARSALKTSVMACLPLKVTVWDFPFTSIHSQSNVVFFWSYYQGRECPCEKDSHCTQCLLQSWNFKAAKRKNVVNINKCVFYSQAVWFSCVLTTSRGVFLSLHPPEIFVSQFLKNNWLNVWRIFIKLQFYSADEFWNWSRQGQGHTKAKYLRCFFFSSFLCVNHLHITYMFMFRNSGFFSQLRLLICSCVRSCVPDFVWNIDFLHNMMSQ